MDADGRIEVRVSRTHDRRGGATGREPGDIDASWLDREVAHDLTRDAGDQRGLAAIPLLVAALNQFQHFETFADWGCAG